MKTLSRMGLVFIVCLFAVPMAARLLPGAFSYQSVDELIYVGFALGALHAVLRPVIRLFSAPIGCLTFGLIGPIIDIGLFYWASSLIEGFSVTRPLYAALTSLMINAICMVVGGRK